MEIKIQFRKFVLAFSFGYNTKWFAQSFFFSITKEYFDENMEISFADMLYHTKIREY